MNDDTFINNEYPSSPSVRRWAFRIPIWLPPSTACGLHGRQWDVSMLRSPSTIKRQRCSQMNRKQAYGGRAPDLQTIASTGTWACWSYRSSSYWFAAVIHFRKAPQYLAGGIFRFVCVSIDIWFVGQWAALDFSNFWTFFSRNAFLERLWLFDGTQCRMNQHAPEQIFADIIARVGVYAGAVIATLIVLASSLCAFLGRL